MLSLHKRVPTLFQEIYNVHYASLKFGRLLESDQNNLLAEKISQSSASVCHGFESLIKTAPEEHKINHTNLSVSP